MLSDIPEPDPTFQVELIMGDWSGDGHGVTDSHFIKSNLTAKEIEKAYKKASMKMKFNFIEKVASGYADYAISAKDIKILSEYITFPFATKSDNDLDVEEYLNIYLEIIKVGNPTFTFSFIKKTTESVNIGGYGFYNC